MSYYDILGVTPDASRDEVKAAWRQAAERFEPGQGGSSAQFRLFNQAAEVLLDPERRTAYDEQLAGGGRSSEELVSVGAPAPPEETQRTGAEPHRKPFMRRGTKQDDRPPAAETQPEKVETPTRAEAAESSSSPERRGIPLLALAALGLLTAVAVGLAAYFWTQAAEAEAVEQTQSRAPATAERAAAAVLAYNHKTLEADKETAVRFMTDDYRKQYADTFDTLVVDNATETKAKVEAKVVASSVSHAAPEQAKVLLFVNQTTTSTAHDGEPQTALNRVMLDMVKVDDTWLVDDIASY